MSLDAVRGALVSDAQADADASIAAATRAADDRVEAARAEAARVIADARATGATEAEHQLAAERAATRREAREIVLRAKRRVYDMLREAVHVAVLELPSDPGYPDFVARLERVARDQLGADARIAHDPGGAGGLIASAGARSVDYRLVAIADRCLDALGDELDELWK